VVPRAGLNDVEKRKFIILLAVLNLFPVVDRIDGFPYLGVIRNVLCYEEASAVSAL
jgi:hypothetical protein